MRIFFIWATLVIVFPLLHGTVLAEDRDLIDRITKLEERVQTIESQLKQTTTIDIDSVKKDVKKLITHQECDNTRLDKNYFIICYNEQWRTATWVGYHLDRKIISGTAIAPNSFREDAELPPEDRSTVDDYKNSNYDKGLMAPAVVFRSNPEAMSLTFLLSNIVPRSPHLNRKTWPLLEQFIINLTSKGANTWVFTGNIVNKEDNKLHKRVVIPDSCFKAILHEDKAGNLSAYAFVIPNAASNLSSLKDYMYTISHLEGLTDIDFFSYLPDEIETKLENETPAWPI